MNETESAAHRIEKILVPYDFGELATHALSYAKLLADRFSASIELLHVVANPYLPVHPDLPLALQLPPAFVEELLRNAQQRLENAVSAGDRSRYRIKCTATVGEPRHEILLRAAAGNADLVVMGTHGRKGAAHLVLGSVAERVVRGAPCPVLTVR